MSERVRIYDGLTGDDITDRENLACKSGPTLHAALIDLGLPVSGTKRQKAARILGTGLTPDQVEQRYGWRARASREAKDADA